MSRWLPYIAVGIGSALGSLLRFLVSLMSITVLGSNFPWGTLLVNLAGSWLIAWLSILGAHYTHGFVARWQPFLVAGFCGSFTTFSLFSLETFHLVDLGYAGWALVYVAISIPLWLIAAWHGQKTARKRCKTR